MWILLAWVVRLALVAYILSMSVFMIGLVVVASHDPSAGGPLSFVWFGVLFVLAVLPLFAFRGALRAIDRRRAAAQASRKDNP